MNTKKKKSLSDSKREEGQLVFFHFGEFKTKKEEEKYFKAYKEWKKSQGGSK